MERVIDADRCWFQQHPGRRYQLRYSFPVEMNLYANPDPMVSYCRVQKLSPEKQQRIVFEVRSPLVRPDLWSDEAIIHFTAPLDGDEVAQVIRGRFDDDINT
jgi:hypothetical protein